MGEKRKISLSSQSLAFARAVFLESGLLNFDYLYTNNVLAVPIVPDPEMQTIDLYAVMSRFSLLLNEACLIDKGKYDFSANSFAEFPDFPPLAKSRIAEIFSYESVFFQRGINVLVNARYMDLWIFIGSNELLHNILEIEPIEVIEKTGNFIYAQALQSFGIDKSLAILHEAERLSKKRNAPL